MTRIALVLARYTLSEGDRALSGSETQGLLEVLKDAQPIAYRKTEPRGDDFDTYIIAPKAGKRKEELYLTFQVCRDISFRQVRKPDRKSQTVKVALEDTDDCDLSRVVLLPRLGVLAADDGSGDGHLGGWVALKRFEAIVKQRSNAVFSTEAAGSPRDLAKAIETWDLDRFMFQARPFNPHPSNPGRLLSDLMAKDGIGQLRAVAVPHDGSHIKPKDDGIVKEAIGLAEKGYATYGANGTTKSGAEAVIRKQEFSLDRHTNLERLRGPQQLRVYVEADDEDKAISKIIDVLIEFFDPNAVNDL